MFAAKTKFTNRTKAVVAAAKKAKFENLRHAALSIRKTAARSIRQRKDKKKASEAGTPPHTHGGFLRRALWAAWEETSAMIGFQFSKIGTVAATHEHGLAEEGRDYPERPTIGPALERNVERFHRDWRASIE